MERFYRLIIVALMLLQVAWFLVPWGFAYDEFSIGAISWLGYGSLLNSTVISVASYLILFLYVLSYFGLLFFNRFFRLIYIFLAVIGGLMIPFYGLSVQSGYEAVIGYFITLGDGFVICLSFFSSVKNKFNKVESY